MNHENDRPFSRNECRYWVRRKHTEKHGRPPDNLFMINMAEALYQAIKQIPIRNIGAISPLRFKSIRDVARLISIVAHVRTSTLRGGLRVIETGGAARRIAIGMLGVVTGTDGLEFEFILQCDSVNCA